MSFLLFEIGRTQILSAIQRGNQCRIGLRADGSDFVTVVAEITDKNGNVKRLNNYYIKFFVEGEGRILGGANVLANPAPVK